MARLVQPRQVPEKRWRWHDTKRHHARGGVVRSKDAPPSNVKSPQPRTTTHHRHAMADDTTQAEFVPSETAGERTHFCSCAAVRSASCASRRTDAASCRARFTRTRCAFSAARVSRCRWSADSLAASSARSCAMNSAQSAICASRRVVCTVPWRRPANSSMAAESPATSPAVFRRSGWMMTQ